MILAVLFSGGKDSCLALHKALKEGHEVKYLLTMMPETQESFMFHAPNLGLITKQAEMLDIEIIFQATKAEKEKELEDLVTLIKTVVGKVDGVCVGGIASNYQGSRVKKICVELGLKFYAPLWNYSPDEVWKGLFENDFKVILIKIACEGLDESFLGKTFDKSLFDKMRTLSQQYKFRIDFEGGEAESAVLDMPEFKKEIKLRGEIIKEGEYNSLLKIKSIK